MLSRLGGRVEQEDLNEVWSEVMALEMKLGGALDNQELISARVDKYEDQLARLRELVSMSSNQDSVIRLEKRGQPGSARA